MQAAAHSRTVQAANNKITSTLFLKRRPILTVSENVT
jgi:hypothetical protein